MVLAFSTQAVPLYIYSAEIHQGPSGHCSLINNLFDMRVIGSGLVRVHNGENLVLGTKIIITFCSNYPCKSLVMATFVQFDNAEEENSF